MKQSISQILIEFISVVFAVLLALALNAYKESLETRRKADKIKESILMECLSNQEKVKSVLDDNREYFDYIDSLSQLQEKDVKGFGFKFEFELLTKSAWEIAHNTDAVNSINQEFLLQAADLYELQEFIMTFSQEIFSQVGVFISRAESYNSAELVQTMHYYLRIINSVANEYLMESEKFLEANRN